MNTKRKEENDSDEEDYMSNDFLNQIVDTRPGLVFNRSLARKYEVEKKSKQKIEENNLKLIQTSSKALEKINREEALKTSSLNETNKGFNLMLKMGYEKGQGLGSRASTSTKLIEPISVEIKTDRGGLGQMEERKRKLNEYVKLNESKTQTDKEIADAYLESKRNRFLIKKLRGNLFKCQKICYQLDSTVKNLKKPEIAKWFWPIHIIRALNQKEKEANNDLIHLTVFNETAEIKNEGFSAPSTESVKNETNFLTKQTVDLNLVYNERLNSFLKEGNEPKIENDEEVDEASDEEDEKRFKSCCEINKEKENSDLDNNEEDEFDELNEDEISKRIETICLYLRENYYYCVWCAVRYESNEDLTTSCPGLTQDEHED